jgi:hypothetical protein
MTKLYVSKNNEGACLYEKGDKLKLIILKYNYIPICKIINKTKGGIEYHWSHKELKEEFGYNN